MTLMITYDRNNSIIVLATLIMIVNYDHKTFIVQATGVTHDDRQMTVKIIL